MIKLLQEGLEAQSICVLHTAEERKNYTNKDLLNASIIFSDVLFNKVYELIEIENIEEEPSMAMAEQCGHELRMLIKKYTNIDMHDIAKEP